MALAHEDSMGTSWAYADFPRTSFDCMRLRSRSWALTALTGHFLLEYTWYHVFDFMGAKSNRDYSTHGPFHGSFH